MLKRVEEYIRTRLLLLKVEVTDKLSDALSAVFIRIILFFMASLVFFFVSIAVAVWIGEVYNSYITGFFAIAAVYFIIFILLLIFRNKLLKKNVKNDIIRTLFQDSINEE